MEAGQAAVPGLASSGQGSQASPLPSASLSAWSGLETKGQLSTAFTIPSPSRSSGSGAGHERAGVAGVAEAVTVGVGLRAAVHGAHRVEDRGAVVLVVRDAVAVGVGGGWHPAVGPGAPHRGAAARGAGGLADRNSADE